MYNIHAIGHYKRLFRISVVFRLLCFSFLFVSLFHVFHLTSLFLHEFLFFFNFLCWFFFFFLWCWSEHDIEGEKEKKMKKNTENYLKTECLYYRYVIQSVFYSAYKFRWRKYKRKYYAYTHTHIHSHTHILIEPYI